MQFRITALTTATTMTCPPTEAAETLVAFADQVAVPDDAQQRGYVV